ncbi:alpha/beta-hydrolase [Neoconidiobolus thromboides FSU 785]|nr:alpha/beta-hydrolase [Neoconidiobolus thromboides FSU 785]
MKSNLQRSLISVCATENILFLNCICPHLYHEYQLIKNKQVDSLVTIAVEKKPKLIIISYQPSLSYQNYITSFEIPSIDLPTASPGVKVHYGFYTHYLANYFKVREALGKILENPNYDNYTLHITGYSLGAGVATIATPDWVQFMKDRNDTRSIQLYVYASPRPGNLEFSKYLSELNIKMGRYNKAKDLISNLPTRGFGYTHAIPEIYHNNVGNKSEFVYCDQKFDEDPKCGISQENKVSIWPHILPFNQLVPTPPYC